MSSGVARCSAGPQGGAWLSAVGWRAVLSFARGLTLYLTSQPGVSFRMTASKPTKDYVFVSYARSDSEVVGRVAGALEARGVDLWRDTEDISAATFWSEQIVDAIQHSSGVLLFLSPASAYSENVSKELSIALEERKAILPVYLEPTDLSNRLRYQLTGIQYLELPDHADVGRLDQIAAVLQNLVAGNSTGPVKPPRRSSAGPGAGRRAMHQAAHDRDPARRHRP